MALTKVSTGVVDMSEDTGGLIIAKGTTAQQPTCTAAILGSIRENTTENKVEVCTANSGTPAWQFLEEVGPTFTPLTVEYLVVAGGGSGGGFGGGGGAGGVLSNVGATSLVLVTGTAYSLTVGNGAARTTYATGGYPNYTPGQQGGSSSISGTGITTITSIGGAGGAGYTVSAVTGGSGGGGAEGNSSGSYIGSSGTAGQGNSGGNGILRGSAGNTYGAGGGGGGAGVPGGNGSSSGGVSVGGGGGNGIESSITGTPTYYAGGGGGMSYPSGGGASSLGGGGAGGNYNGGAGAPAQNGTNNLGGGGGGSYGYQTATVGLGGSGVVILKYPNYYTLNISASPAPVNYIRTTSAPAGLGITIDIFTCNIPTTNASLTFTFS
jgi:hypothetical protein